MTYFPDVTVEFSPSTDPLETPVWVDITGYLRSFSYSRGRNRPLDRAEAGTATLVLDNTAGRFDPGNPDSTYYPGVRSMRRIRLTATIPSVYDPFQVGDDFLGGSETLGAGPYLIPLFSGFVETWGQEWNPAPSPTADPTVVVRAVDAFKAFNLMPNLTESGSGSWSGQLLDSLLDDIGWPAEDRVIDRGQFVISAPTASLTSSRLAAFLEIDASEGGLLFIDGAGRVVFFDSAHLITHPPASDAVWGDLGEEDGERDYGLVSMAYDETTIWNHVTVTAPSLDAQLAESTRSQDRYMQRSTTLATVLMNTTDMQTRAFDHVMRYSEPRRQITELEVGRLPDIDWPSLLAHELQDRVVVRRRPVGQAVIEQDSVIEGITVDAPHRSQWNVRWKLSATQDFNRLSAQQSSFEDGTAGGWVVLANATLSVNAVAFGGSSIHGEHHLVVTPVGNGDSSVETTPNQQESLRVVEGETYTAVASAQAESGTNPDKLFHVAIVWRDAGGGVVASSTGASITEAGGEFVNVQATVTDVAPSGAVYATVRVVIESAETAEEHKVDAVGFSRGDVTAWSMGRGDVA